MSVINELNASLKEAMKEKDRPKLDAIRQVKSEIEEKRAEKGEEVTDELALGVMKSYVKNLYPYRFLIGSYSISFFYFLVITPCSYSY